MAPNPLAEYGFLVVHVDSRGVPGLGKRALDAVYQRLGQAEIDDMAAGVKSLWSRAYVDRARVGIFGTSYGGYTAAMGLLRDRRRALYSLEREGVHVIDVEPQQLTLPLINQFVQLRQRNLL